MKIVKELPRVKRPFEDDLAALWGQLGQTPPLDVRPVRVRDTVGPMLTCLVFEKVKDLLDKNAAIAQQQLCAIREVFAASANDLRAIFMFYCRLGKQATASGRLPTALAPTEFTKFCGDVRVVDKRLTQASLDLIFIRANWELDAGEGGKKKGGWVGGCGGMKGRGFALGFHLGLNF
jgi:hypothetical protein